MRPGGYGLEFLLGFLACNCKHCIYLDSQLLHTYGKTHARRIEICLARSKRVSRSRRVSASCKKHCNDKLRMKKRMQVL